jgi:hypothetical protein
MIKKYLPALALTLATFWGNAQVTQTNKLSANLMQLLSKHVKIGILTIQ